jgi:hypothetical protein
VSYYDIGEEIVSGLMEIIATVMKAPSFKEELQELQKAYNTHHERR